MTSALRLCLISAILFCSIKGVKMSVTQYIGARYVPLFYTASDNTNNWEAGVQYEALTVVTYLNQCYTSKIPVPASVGNPADNPQYWILSGAYNAQISSLVNDVTALQGDVGTLQNDVDSLESDVNEYVLFVSDSYGVSGGIYAFPDLLDDYGIGNFVKGWDHVELAGSAFAPWPGQDNFADQLAAYSGSIKDKVTHIIAVGGTNDAKLGLTTDTTTGLESLISTAIANYPALKKISVIYCPHVNGTTYSQPNTLGTYNTVINHTTQQNIDFCAYNAINIFAWNHLQADGVHPDQTGQRQIAEALVRFISTGTVRTIPYRLNATGTMRSGWAMGVLFGDDYSYLSVQAIATNEPDLTIAGSTINLAEAVVMGQVYGYDLNSLKSLGAWIQVRKDGVVLGSAWTPTNTGRFDVIARLEVAVPTAAIQSK